jgi:serine/threonine protein kinase
MTLGTYTVERELGRGGMGAVYTAVHSLLGRRAAVKVLLGELSRDQAAVQRFFNEARAATAIKHPSIVEIYDFGWSPDGAAYIVMELLEGESLATRLARVGRLPLDAALVVARQIATALGAAHRAGIVHRDLKPDNVFLVPDPEVVTGERVKLLDFGIAKLLTDTGGLAKTTTGAIVGTPYYMSPEQCEGSRSVDAKSDLYALGIILFQMISGRLPFEGGGLGGILGAHQFVPAPALRTVAPDAPAEVEAFVARLLSKAPAERPGSADEVAAILARLGAPTGPNLGIAPSTPLPGPMPGPLPTPAPAPAPMPTPMPTRAGDLGSASTLAGTPPPPTSTTVRPSTLPPTATSTPARGRGLWLALGAVALAGAAVAAVVLSGGSSPGAAAAVDAAVARPAADAAQLAEVLDGGALDAGGDALQAQAQQALDDRRWDTALALGNDLLTAGHPAARAIVSQAKQGKLAADALAAMRAAEDKRDYRTVRAKLDEVYTATLDGDPDRAGADEVIARVRPLAIAKAEADVARLVKAGRCMDARKVAAEASVDWGTEHLAASTKAAARCKESTAVAGGVDAPPPPPPPTVDPTAAAAEAITTAAAANDWAEVVQLCRKLGVSRLSGRRPALIACAIGACKTGRATDAASALRLLPVPARRRPVAACIESEVLLPLDLVQGAGAPPPTKY